MQYEQDIPATAGRDPDAFPIVVAGGLDGHVIEVTGEDGEVRLTLADGSFAAMDRAGTEDLIHALHESLAATTSETKTRKAS